LTNLYAESCWIGSLLSPLGIKVRVHAARHIFVALVVHRLPFVVRTVQPGLERLEKSCEEAARRSARGADHHPPRRAAVDHARPVDRFALAPRARRRIRFGQLHRRQPAERIGDRAAC